MNSISQITNGDDYFECLSGTLRYRSYKKTTELLNIVYDRLNARMSGEDKTRNPITLIWDEYMANMLALIGENKKEAATVMNKVSEILLMGRSMSVRFVCSCQRPDAVAFPVRKSSKLWNSHNFRWSRKVNI